MKNAKTNLLLMAALVAVQTGVHAKDKEEKSENKQPRTWRQAAYDNRYGIAAGSAAVGLGALGFVYGQDFMTWYNAQPADIQAQAQDKIEKSVEIDLQNIAEKQEAVEHKTNAKKHSAAQEKEVAIAEKAIAKDLKDVAAKQSWLQAIMNAPQSYMAMRANDPALLQMQANIDADNAAYLAENPDYRSSDDFRSDRERAEYMREYQKSGERLGSRNNKAQDNADFLRGRNAMNALPGAFDASNSSVRDVQNIGSGLRIQESLAPKKYKNSVRPANNSSSNDFPSDSKQGSGSGRVSHLLAGDYNDSIKDAASNAANSVAQSTKDAYNSVVNYFTPTAEQPQAPEPAPAPDLVPDSELSVSNSANNDIQDGGQY